MPGSMDDVTLVEHLRASVPDAAIAPVPAIDMPTVIVDREHLLDVASVLRDDPSLQFALLSDVTCVDELPAEPRYALVYHLACLGPAYAGPAGPAPVRRLRLKVHLPAADPRAPSLAGIWPVAGWPEREVYDLFGIVFDGHPDLRRILMADDWEGHPLRKDYPVQIRKETSSWSPLQMTAEEFAANVRAQRERVTRDASRAGAPGGGRPGSGSGPGE